MTAPPVPSVAEMGAALRAGRATALDLLGLAHAGIRPLDLVGHAPACIRPRRTCTISASSS